MTYQAGEIIADLMQEIKHYKENADFWMNCSERFTDLFENPKFSDKTIASVRQSEEFREITKDILKRMIHQLSELKTLVKEANHDPIF